MSFSRHRLAAQAHTMYVGLDALRIAEAAIGDELDAEPFLRVVHEGEQLMESVHAWVHTFVGPSLKTRREVFERARRWHTTMRVFVRAWATYDRSSFQDHCASVSKLESRLVRRMVEHRGGEQHRPTHRIVLYALHGRDLRRSARRARRAGRPRPRAQRAGVGHADAR